VETEKKQIKSFRDLDVYSKSYNLAIIVAKDLLTMLPQKEKFDLTDQLSRSTKAIPRLIAEGYAKKHQKSGFQKYLDDAMAEANETIVGVEMCRDIYKIDKNFCEKLVDGYDMVGRQLYNLAKAWRNFKSR
jgi:four helix bundle protein